MAWMDGNAADPAADGPLVAWLAPPPIPLAPETLEALIADGDASATTAVRSPEAELAIDAMRLDLAPAAEEHAGDAVPAAAPAATPDDAPSGAPGDAPGGAVASAAAATTAQTPRPAPSSPLVTAATDGAVVTADGVTVDPSAFDGDGTAVIVIDDGFSPWYDQSDVVFAHDFSGAGDRWAGQWSWKSHGSWVADIASDVAPGTDIIHLKVVGDDAGGASFADIEEALQWSVRWGERFGAAAVNLSLGFGNVTREVETMLSDEIAALARRDIATTVAAGNAGRSHDDGVNLLAADPHAIAVSAVDRADHFTAWTQKSAALTDVAALGTDVVVDSRFDWGVKLAGTSFAAPYVAGTAARLQDAADALLGTRLSPEEIVAVMTAAGAPVRDAGDDGAGYRVADADAAVDHFIAHHQDFAADALLA
ncbi:MAG: S8 family serine peptidase [Alphaproteobacteria bacterium]|jgi:hypothetical protein|nr:S8 family serine peptidase [Alphaproteobacteria bacterium]